MFEIEQFVSCEYCLKCRGCCRFNQSDTVWSPVFLKEEISRFTERGIDKSRLNNNKIRLLPRPEEDKFLCGFLNADDNRCLIYPVRPFECMLYPFLINRCGNKIFLAVDLNCPFVRETIGPEGERFFENPVMADEKCSYAAGQDPEKEGRFNGYAHYLLNFLTSPDRTRILKNNLIPEYENVLNIAVLWFCHEA